MTRLRAMLSRFTDRRVDPSPFQRAAILFLVSGILVTPLWPAAQSIGLLPFLLAALLAMAVLSEPGKPAQLQEVRAFPGVLEASGTLLIALGAPAIYLVLTWRQDFPFAGDHDYHLLQSEIAFGFWSRFFVPTVLLLAGLWLLMKRRVTALPIVSLFILLPLLGLYVHGDFFFTARYPGTFYFLAFPAKVVASLFDWSSPLNALRVTNLLSIPAWLLVLRPIFVRRWPDRTVIPFSVFFFYQKDVVYYFTASYLEPWALVLIITAVERLLRHQSEDPWIAYFLVGAAALIKEQAILILPFVALATWIESDGTQKRAALISTVIAGCPFVLYYLFRRASSVWRTAGLAQLGTIANTARLGRFTDRVMLQFGPSVWLVIAAGVGLLYAAVVDRRRRAVLLALLTAALFQVLFFYADRISVPWTGYPRFHLIPVVLLGSFLIWLMVVPLANRRLLPVVAISVCLGLVNGISLISFMRAATRPDVNRNFFEHVDSPMYFPVNRLVSGAGQTSTLDRVTDLRVVSNVAVVIPKYDLSAFPVAYPRLSDQYRINVRKEPLQLVAGECRCRESSEANLALYVYFTRLGTNITGREKAIEISKACDAELRRTCQRVETISYGGQPLGALGVGKKQN